MVRIAALSAESGGTRISLIKFSKSSPTSTESPAAP
jgi:hypothetical protein